MNVPRQKLERSDLNDETGDETDDVRLRYATVCATRFLL